MSDDFHMRPDDYERYSSGRQPQDPDMGDDGTLDRLRAMSQPEGSRRPQRERKESVVSRVKNPLKGTRRRPSGNRGGASAARIAAPAVFLVAVIVLVVLMFQSGLLGGEAEVTVSPTPKATSTKAGATPAKSATKVYVVKSGDTLSGIAVKFGTTVSALEDLNPNMSASTLGVGDKLKVPRE